MVFDLDLGACQTLSHISSGLGLHVRPTIKFLEVQVHFVLTWMDRVLCVVSFIHENFFVSTELWCPDSIHEIVGFIIFDCKVLIHPPATRVLFPAQGICYYVGLARMISDVSLVVVE